MRGEEGRKSMDRGYYRCCSHVKPNGLSRGIYDVAGFCLINDDDDRLNRRLPSKNRVYDLSGIVSRLMSSRMNRF